MLKLFVIQNKLREILLIITIHRGATLPCLLNNLAPSLRVEITLSPLVNTDTPLPPYPPKL